MAWGRAIVGGSAAGAGAGMVNGTNGNGSGKGADGKEGKEEGVRRVNVLATGSVDQTVKVSFAYL